MPSWKKVIVSGSDAKVATLFTSGHLTASGNFSATNISGSLTGSFRKIVVDDLIEATASVAISSSFAYTSSHSELARTSSLTQKVEFDATEANEEINILLGSSGAITEGGNNLNTQIQIAETGHRLNYNPAVKRLTIASGGTAATIDATSTYSNVTRYRAVSQSTAHNPSEAYLRPMFYKMPFFNTGNAGLNPEAELGVENTQTHKALYVGMKETGIMWNPFTYHLSASMEGSASFGTYIGDGSQLTGIVTGIFQPTGSFQSTANDLQITGSVDISSHITSSGNISGSSISTASFGSVQVTGMSVPNVVDVSSSFSSRTTTLETTMIAEQTNIDNLEAKVGQSLNTTDTPQFAALNIDGDLVAQRFIVSSSVSVITSSFSSGSTIFGDDITDIHKFSGSVSISGSISANGLAVVTSSAQIADEISGSFAATSASIATARQSYSQSISSRLGSVEAGNVGDGVSSGTNTGDITLNTSTADYLSIDGSQQITLGKIDLATDLTGSIAPINLVASDVQATISGSLGTNAVLIRSLTAAGITGSSTQLSSSVSSRITSVEASVGGQDLAKTASPSFQNMSLTGSLKISGSEQVTAIYANNIQNGYPTSNNWGSSLEGSYFNNFTNETHVSEILRFIAGAMSHSLDIADAAPNSKYLNSVSTAYTGTSTTSRGGLLNGVLGSSFESSKLSQHWTSSAAIDFSTTGSYRAVQEYLNLKGFIGDSDRGTYGNDTGTNPFHGSYASSTIPTTISTNGDFDNFTFSVTSVAGGSTNFNSSADGQLFGLGTLSSGNAYEYQVRIIASQSFSDTGSISTPSAASNTYHTNSFKDYTQNSFGTSNGLTLAKINTSQPAVIPAAYQDGKFASVSSPMTGRFYTGGSQNENSISASGYYKFHDIKIGIKSGSQSDFVYKNGSDSSVFFYLYAGGLPSDITTSVPTTTISNPNLVRTAFSATSRSLSGAPYLLTTTYSHTFSSEATKSFDPAYSALNALQHDISTDNFNTIGTTSLGSHTTVNIDSSGVNTSSAGVKGVLSADKSTLRADGDIPHIDDISFLSSSFTFSLDNNYNNTVESKATQAALNYTNTFRVRARNWKNNTQSNTSTTVNFYDATLFDQPSASGSMAIYSRAQGYDAGALDGTTEAFSGEDFRIQLNNNVTSFAGDAWSTSYALNQLGNYDLQVKPGYLVDPGSSDGYWYYTGFGSGTYKYYIRRFSTSGTKNSMTLNVGQTLQAWNSTSNGVSAAILFESSATPNYSRARIYDPTATVSNDIETNISTDNHKNPFSSAIDLYGNSGGGISSSTYTIPMRNIDGMTLSGTDNELYVILRYKSVTTPVTTITLAFS